MKAQEVILRAISKQINWFEAAQILRISPRQLRPMRGMLLHIDGSTHRWLGGEQWHDLIVVLDDASSEVYYAQLVEQESTETVLQALREVVDRRGIFCALYSDRASHFWRTP